MLRLFVCAAVALVLSAGDSFAAKEKKGQSASGTVKKIDAATGTLTVAVKSKSDTTDKEFKIGDATKVLIFAGDDKKEMVGKDGLKSTELKVGAMVTIISDADGKVTEVRVGTPKRKK